MTARAELFCPHCDFSADCGPSAMLDWIAKAHMLRRDAQPDPELIGELFRAAVAKLVCPKCHAAGLAVHDRAAENDEDWGMTRKCEECGRPIPRERLEVFPNAKMCASCQERSDRGDLQTTTEYCPRCGTPLVVRQSSAPGITRYVQTCPKCRR